MFVNLNSMGKAAKCGLLYTDGCHSAASKLVAIGNHETRPPNSTHGSGNIERHHRLYGN